MITKNYFKLLSLMLLSLMLSCSKPIRLEYANDKLDDYYFRFKTKFSYTNLSISQFYKPLPYVYNLSEINDDIIFTYKNNFESTRIGMTQDMLPNYTKDLTYAMRVRVYTPFMHNYIECDNILIYKNDSIIPITSFDSKYQKTIYELIIEFSKRDLELK